MRAYAKRFGEDEERWAVTGPLHDMDYENTRHVGASKVGVSALRELGYPEDVLNAIGHASLVPRDTCWLRRSMPSTN